MPDLIPTIPGVTTGDIWVTGLGAAMLSGLTAALVAWGVTRASITADRRSRETEARAAAAVALHTTVIRFGPALRKGPNAKALVPALQSMWELPIVITVAAPEDGALHAYATEYVKNSAASMTAVGNGGYLASDLEAWDVALTAGAAAITARLLNRKPAAPLRPPSWPKL